MAKRANGEGTMRKRPDGLWEQTMMIGYTPEGKRKRKSFYGKTQRELKEKVEQFKLQQAMGLTTEADISFGEWADQWYEGHKSQVSEVTYESYKYTLKILKETLGNRKLRTIKPLEIEQFLKNLSESKSDSLVKKCRTMLHQIMHKAEANDLIMKNPIRFVDKFKKADHESKKDSFTREEIGLLMNCLPHDRMGHTIRLMIGTGLRVQEAVCLTKDTIEADGSIIRVRSAVQMVKGKTVLVEGHTKTFKSKRDIPVPEFVRESAIFLREQADPFTWSSNVPGTVYNLKAFRTKYTTYLGKIEGVRPLTPHCCRHTYVTLLQSLNVSLEVIAGLTGHTDIQTTREYLHIQPETAKLVTDVFSKELEKL